MAGVVEERDRPRSDRPSWPLSPDITEAELEQRLFANREAQAGARRRIEPDWTAVARELKRPGVTLQILWEEDSGAQPDAYSYSRYCQLYRELERRLTPSMRQNHLACDKAFVDSSGKKVPIFDPHSGEVCHGEIFVAVLGASNLTYAEASWTQSLPDWIGAHVRMFKFWGAAPRLLVPDNIKSGVHKACFYDPELECGVLSYVALRHDACRHDTDHLESAPAVVMASPYPRQLADARRPEVAGRS